MTRLREWTPGLPTQSSRSNHYTIAPVDRINDTLWLNYAMLSYFRINDTLWLNDAMLSYICEIQVKVFILIPSLSHDFLILKSGGGTSTRNWELKISELFLVSESVNFHRISDYENDSLKSVCWQLKLKAKNIGTWTWINTFKEFTWIFFF